MSENRLVSGFVILPNRGSDSCYHYSLHSVFLLCTSAVKSLHSLSIANNALTDPCSGNMIVLNQYEAKERDAVQ